MTRIVAFVLWFVGTSYAFAADVVQSDPVDYQGLVEKLGPGLSIQSQRASVMPGYDELIVNSQVILVSKDKRFLILGPVLDMQDDRKGQQLGEDFISDYRADLLDTIDANTLITYKPDVVKAKIKVFTDVNCYYCRKLHSDINKILEEGIEVSYLSFPVSGGRGKSGSGYSKAVSVWCSDDPNTQLTKAKLGDNIEEKQCDDNPIDKHFNLARDLNINVTPTIIFEDGHVERGYLPPSELVNMATLHTKRGDQ